MAPGIPAGDTPHDRDHVERLFASIRALPREMAAFAYFDRDWRLLGMRHSPSPAVAEATIPTRQVARDALAFDARWMLMAHNHPSGDWRPSADDVAATTRLARILAAIGIVLVDHWVLAAEGATSLRAAGFL